MDSKLFKDFESMINAYKLSERSAQKSFYETNEFVYEYSAALASGVVQGLNLAISIIRNFEREQANDHN